MSQFQFSSSPPRHQGDRGVDARASLLLIEEQPLVSGERSDRYQDVKEVFEVRSLYVA